MRFGLGAVGAVLLALAAIAVLAHFVRWRHGWLIGLAVTAPYLMALAVPAVVLLLVARAGPAAVSVALVVLVAGALTQLPLLRAAEPPADAARLIMLTANLHLGQADAVALVASVRSQHVDLLTVQELTPAEADRLQAAGLDNLLPHRQLDARDVASGVGLWSRYPLAQAHDVPGFELAFVTARVLVPGVTPAPGVVAAHMPGPWPQSATKWLADLRRLGPTLRELAAAPGAGALLVGADLNATLDTVQYRRVLRQGWHDAAEQAGAGITRTFPADTHLPPLLAIDHVLTYRATATAVRTVALPGSDHRGLLVTIAIAHTG